MLILRKNLCSFVFLAAHRAQAKPRLLFHRRFRGRKLLLGARQAARQRRLVCREVCAGLYSLEGSCLFLATATDHDCLARLSQSHGARRKPCAVTSLSLWLLPLCQKLADFTVDLCAVVLFGRAKLKVAVVTGKVVTGKSDNRQARWLLDCGSAANSTAANFRCVTGATQNVVLWHGRELCAYAVCKVGGVFVMLRGAASLFLCGCQTLGGAGSHGLADCGLVTVADNHAGDYGFRPLASCPARQCGRTFDASGGASDRETLGVYVDKTGRDAATHVHLAVVVCWQFCKALGCRCHIFRFLVSWFNSHCLAIRYTLGVYLSTTIFDYFFQPHPMRVWRRCRRAML